MSRVLLAVTAALIALAAGCQTINKGLTESVLGRKKPEQWQVHYGSRVHYLLNNSTMKDLEFQGSLASGDTTIQYQWGLADQAQCIADKTDELLKKVQERTGVTITTHCRIYLLRFDDRPQDFDVVLDGEPNELPLPLFVQAGDESCESILVQNRGYPYMIVHELVETSLAAGCQHGVVLPDPSWGILGIAVHVNNYTRWFREGVANYGGYVAYQALSEDIPSARRLHYRQMLLHTSPFSSLAVVRDRLFSWVQSSQMGHERMYYNAALGLFLLIEDTYGPEAIRKIVEEVGARRAVNGHDLLKITEQVLGADIRQLARDFRFPEVGIELERVTPALALNSGMEVQEGLFVIAMEKDGPAVRAGLREEDVITAVGATPMANSLDFELALFKVRNQPSVPLTVVRPNAETSTITLPLQMPEPAGKAATPSGKRTKPLKKGRIESTNSPLLSTF
jgi:hypothetical protein